MEQIDLRLCIADDNLLNNNLICTQIGNKCHGTSNIPLLQQQYKQ